MSDAGYDYAALIEDGRVHGSLYVSSAVYGDEMRRLFHDGWAFCAHESEIPAAGDWLTRRIGAARFIVSRARDGQIHVLANRCSHRGATICPGERGNTLRWQCPYHGWTFAVDGSLVGVPHPGGFTRDKAALGLDRAGQIATYRGFVFVNPSGTAGPLDAHLGDGGRALIDRLCDLSPTGRIRVVPRWIGHRIASNWKMWPESDNDGYHFPFVHASVLRAAPDTYYDDTVVHGAEDNASRTVDHGRGHFELDLSGSYPAPLAWLGTPADKVAGYAAALQCRLGATRADELLRAGPPHAMIFPNLFLGELNVAIIEPQAVDRTVHWHTAVQFEDVEPAFNRRLLRQSEAALGPASFIVPDDVVVAERMQRGFAGCEARDAARARGWIDLSRGLERETRDAAGRRLGAISDETTNRAFWRHYREVMCA
jgi:phenylpropionate dioxygenase-like ring-hydroxylating dioxygenase large terminal subunit